MNLTEEQKSLLFHALKSVQRTLEETNEGSIYATQNNYFFNLEETELAKRNITLNQLDDLIETTLNELC